MPPRKVNILSYGFRILQIETISSCDMDCSFCAYPARSDKGMTLDERYIHEAVGSLENDDRLKYVCLSHFNEPLLDKRIFGIIRHVREKGFSVMVITNGLRFAKDGFIESLIESKPDFIKISLQNVEPAEFNASRGISRPFSEYKNGIFKFLSLAKGRESKVYVDIAFNFLSPGVKLLSCALGLEMGDPSITDIACDLTPGVERFLSELKSFDASFNFDAHAVPRHIARLKKNYALQDGFRLAGNEFLKFKKFIYGRRQERFLPARRPMGCSTDILGILASGDVVPCCLAYDTSLSMGNIKEEPLPAILERNRFFIENLRSGKDLPIRCRRCLGAPTKRGLLFKQLKDRVVKTLYEGN